MTNFTGIVSSVTEQLSPVTRSPGYQSVGNLNFDPAAGVNSKREFMLTSRFALCMLSASLMIPGAPTVSGQDFPSKPLRILTAEAGGGNDFLARLIAQGLSSTLGQQAIVDNRVLIVAGETVAKP